MKKKLILFITLICIIGFNTNTKACHLASLTVICGPTDIGGGQYSFTIQICTGSGGDISMGVLCGTGAVGSTQNYTISVSGGTVTGVSSSGYTGSIVSGFNGVNSTGSVMSGVLTYFAPSTIYNIPATGDACNLYGSIVQWCWNVTFVTNGLPTTITVNGIEGVETGQNSSACPLSTSAIASPVITNPPPVCESGFGLLTASNCSGIVKWYDTPGGTLLGTGTTFLSPYLTTTTNYYATNTLNGVESSATMGTVTINPLPVISVNSPIICTSTTVDLTASGGDSYIWSTGETGTLTSVTPTSNTTYSITATSVFGCTSSATTSVTIDPSPIATITANGTTTFCENDSVKLTASNGLSYLWSNGETSQSIFVNSTGNYSATIYYGSSCSSVSNTIATTELMNSTATISETVCDSLVLNGQTYTTSGAHIQTLTNALGCDSVLTINLTVNTIDTSVTTLGNMLTSNATSASYQWLDCDNGFAIISGETNATFTATANGNFAVEVTKNACTDTSACYNVTGIGMHHFSLSAGIYIYPNPTTGSFILTLSKGEEIRAVQIFNVLGECVLYQQLITNNQQLTLDVSSLSKGIYFIKVNSEQGSNTKKLIIE